MKSHFTWSKWRSHFPPLFSGAVAVAALLLSPFWAYQWYSLPFLGVSLEQNNVVSQIKGADWQARGMGVEFKDRLVALNRNPVPDIRNVERALAENGYQPLEATFVKPDGQTYSITVTPARPSLTDLISLFIIPYIVGLQFLVIGFWAYRIKPDLQESRALALFTSGLCIMLTTFLDISATHHASILWSLAILLAAGGLFNLALVFPHPIRFVRANPRLRYLPWFLMLTLSPMMVVAIYFPPNPFFYITAWQIGYICFIAAFAFFLTVLIWRIIGSRSPAIRQQSRIILFGSFLGFLPVLVYIVGLISGILFEFHTWLIFPPLVFFPLSITYAILRHRLLEVDALLVRAVTYAMVTAIVFSAFYGLLAFFSLLLGSRVAISNPLVIAAYLFLLVAGLNPLRNLVQTFVDRLFYRSPADYRHAISLLSRALVATPNLAQALNLIEEQLQQSLAPKKFILHLYNDELGKYVPHATRETSAPPYAANHPLVELIVSSTTPLRLPSDSKPPEFLKDENQDLEKLRGFTFVPLRYKRRMIGFMSLGPRRSGEPYNDNDLDFLVAVANQSALALENARLFENLRRTLDQTLEMKNLMDDIFSSVATGIITTDLKKNITLFNRAAENILGVPGKNVMGKPLSYVLPGVSAKLDAETADAQQNVVSLINPPPSRLTERKNLYLRLSLSPLRDAHSNAKGTAIVFEDLTERHELEAERERIRQTFGRVVAPRIRDRLLADAGNLELNGKKQTVTILFADLNGFSAFSEKHDPETVFSTLNAYLSIAAQAILEEEGTLDKFMGDAALAIWNSPDEQTDHALRAVRAAREIIRRSRLAHETFSNPEQRLEFRIGITTGEAIIGNVGTNELFNYTAIGDIVNLAQRLQAAAEKGEILVEKNVHDLISAYVKVGTQKNIAVKGREKTVQACIVEDISA